MSGDILNARLPVALPLPRSAPASRDELLDLLGAAMCFVEDAESDPAYKAGYARRLARQMREAIEREDRKP